MKDNTSFHTLPFNLFVVFLSKGIIFLVSFTHSIVKESLSKRSIRDYGLDSLSPNNFVFTYQQAKEGSESSVRGH